jgi:hypothetical protein
MELDLTENLFLEEMEELGMLSECGTCQQMYLVTKLRELAKQFKRGDLDMCECIIKKEIKHYTNDVYPPYEEYVLTVRYMQGD